MIFGCLGGYGICAVSWAVYYRIRWVPALRDLLADGQRRFATPHFYE